MPLPPDDEEEKQEDPKLDEPNGSPPPMDPPWVYANRVWISKSAHGFNLECIHVLPFTATGVVEEKSVVQARVVLSPAMTKLLLLMLADQVKGYEAQWGPIPTPATVDLVAVPKEVHEDDENADDDQDN